MQVCQRTKGVGGWGVGMGIGMGLIEVWNDYGNAGSQWVSMMLLGLLSGIGINTIGRGEIRATYLASSTRHNSVAKREAERQIGRGEKRRRVELAKSVVRSGELCWVSFLPSFVRVFGESKIGV